MENHVTTNLRSSCRLILEQTSVVHHTSGSLARSRAPKTSPRRPSRAQLTSVGVRDTLLEQHVSELTRLEVFQLLHGIHYVSAAFRHLQTQRNTKFFRSLFEIEETTSSGGAHCRFAQVSPAQTTKQGFQQRRVLRPEQRGIFDASESCGVEPHLAR